MSSRKKTAKPCRQDPVCVSSFVSYYERRNYVEVRLQNIFGMPTIGRIPWADLIASAKRCRPEEFAKKENT